jgi:hypothetical protein
MFMIGLGATAWALSVEGGYLRQSILFLIIRDTHPASG